MIRRMAYINIAKSNENQNIILSRIDTVVDEKDGRSYSCEKWQYATAENSQNKVALNGRELDAPEEIKRRADEQNVANNTSCPRR